MRAGITVVYLTGTPYQIGRAHGKLCRNEILNANSKYFETYNKLKNNFYSQWLPMSRSLESYIPKEYLEEMRGIADGAGIDYEKILFLNTLSTISEAKQCFAFAFKGNDSKLYTLRQIDIDANAKIYKEMILYVIKPQKGYGFAAILNPGWVDGESGINNVWQSRVD